MAVKKYLVTLTIVGIVDAISYMLVTPSLVFYVLQNGGTQEQYGLIMSAFSFSSFCTKPLIGWWSDKQGFRIPYIASVMIALLGGVVYVFASAFPKGSAAVNAVFAARLLSGCGAANSALGFAYIARSVPPSKQTSTNSLLSLCRILGMAIGPALNILVSDVDVPITDNWGLDSLNSVGIVLIVANLISAIAIYVLLEEPKDDQSAEKKDSIPDDADSSVPTSSTSDIFRSLLSVDILVPMLCIFSFNANFQLIETGFTPAANDALGWGPVESSAALGSLSFIIAANMYNVIRLSSKGVSELTLLSGGLINSIIWYTALYFLWIKDSTTWNFVIPVLFSVSSFPYMAATTRTIFTIAINAKPALQPYNGIMQAVLSMAASVAGFTTPGIVAAYMLRSPEEVLASRDMRELTSWSLLAPALSFLVLLGVLYLRWIGAGSAESSKEDSNDSAADEEEPGSLLNEKSSLLSPRSSSIRGSIRSSMRLSQRRRSSNVAIMFEGNFSGLLEETAVLEEEFEDEY
jgi:MFS family permease